MRRNLDDLKKLLPCTGCKYRLYSLLTEWCQYLKIVPGKINMKEPFELRDDEYDLTMRVTCPGLEEKNLEARIGLRCGEQADS